MTIVPKLLNQSSINIKTWPRSHSEFRNWFQVTGDCIFTKVQKYFSMSNRRDIFWRIASHLLLIITCLENTRIIRAVFSIEEATVKRKLCSWETKITLIEEIIDKQENTMQKMLSKVLSDWKKSIKILLITSKSNCFFSIFWLILSSRSSNFIRALQVIHRKD